MLAAAVGMFDGVHLGHQALIGFVREQAAKVGAEPAVFTFNQHPLSVIAPERAPRLLTTLPERMRLLTLAGTAHAFALSFDQKLRLLSAKEFMLMLRDQYDVGLLVVGFNHRFGHDRVEDHDKYQEIGREIGLEVVCCDCKAEWEGRTVSSSAIRHSLSHGDLTDANGMLGRYYSLGGTVARGQGIGHTIGYPTANIVPQSEAQLIPHEGAYAVWAQIDGTLWPAMVNIGHRPTLGKDLDKTIEANIINFSGDLYGCNIKIDFCKRLRKETRFESLDTLKTQLALDRKRTLEILEIDN